MGKPVVGKPGVDIPFGREKLAEYESDGKRILPEQRRAKYPYLKSFL